VHATIPAAMSIKIHHDEYDSLQGSSSVSQSMPPAKLVLKAERIRRRRIRRAKR